MSSMLDQLEGVQENISLAQYTKLQIGGPAEFFYIAKTSDDAAEALKAAREIKTPVTIMSGGANMLISDDGVKGLVIKMENRKWSIDNGVVQAEAGVALLFLAQELVKQGWLGLEFFATIPGCIGGAIRGNAGAFGKETKDVLIRARVFDGGEERWIDAADCQFAYRQSIFKTEAMKDAVILGGEFRVEKGDPETGREYMNEILSTKAKTQSLDLPSAGCMFTNVEFEQGTYNLKNPSQGSVTEQFKREVPKEMIERGVVSSGWLIDSLGLKGKQMGGAKISEKHGNFLVNAGGATAKDMIMLLSYIKQQVRDTYGIQLREEVQHIGF
jgi:UDP-N-acetylmuramate dehydrogenase